MRLAIRGKLHEPKRIHPIEGFRGKADGSRLRCVYERLGGGASREEGGENLGFFGSDGLKWEAEAAPSR